MASVRAVTVASADAARRLAEGRPAEGVLAAKAACPGPREATSADHDDEDREQDLIRRAQKGDRKAFEELYLRFSPAVFRYAIAPLCQDRELAQDLLADTFERALRNIQRFQWQGKGFLPWLIRIGKNVCLDALRRSGRVAPLAGEFEARVPDPTPWSAETVTAAIEIDALQRERITVCLGDLNDRYRRVVELRIVQGASRELAAREMGVNSVGTLDVLLFRACQAFRKAYVRRYGGPEWGP